MSEITIYDIFTPASPASHTFVERNILNQKLDRALQTRGKQIILYGHSGTGKTTILKNKISTYYSKKITTRCLKNITIEDIILDAFNELDIYFKDSIETVSDAKISGGLSAKFLGIQAKLGTEISDGSKETLKKLIALQLTPPTLAKFIGEAGCCWIIEDFHKVVSQDKDRLSQIMKVFMDMADDYPKLKMITIGAVNSAREVIQYDKEMKNRVAEINIELMEHDQLLQIIEKGESILNVKFDETVKEKIVSFSSGLPAVTHNLCLLICQLQGVIRKRTTLFQFTAAHLKKAVNEFIKENEDTFKSIFETATYSKYQRQYESPKDLLYLIIESKLEEFTVNDLSQLLKEKHANYKAGNLKNYLDELTEVEREEVLRYHKGTNSYYFSNPFFKSYVAAKHFEELENVSFTKTRIVKTMSTYLEELDLARVQFLKDFDDFDDRFTDFEDNE